MSSAVALHGGGAAIVCPRSSTPTTGHRNVMQSLILLTVALASAGASGSPEVPKVLFFANPMTSDNDVIRRPRPDVLSVAERHFAELTRGVFDVTITQDGAEVTR